MKFVKQLAPTCIGIERNTLEKTNIKDNHCQDRNCIFKKK